MDRFPEAVLYIFEDFLTNLVVMLKVGLDLTVLVAELCLRLQDQEEDPTPNVHDQD